MSTKQLRFRKMNESEYNVYCEETIARYAEDLIHTGYCNAGDALAQAGEQFNKALPKGFDTPDARLYAVLNKDNEEVGAIFILKFQEYVAAIADFITYSVHRNKGYGLQALEAIEEELKQEGYKAIILNVFEHNTAARSLYEKFGFIDEPKAYNAAMKQLLMVKKFGE